jgi:hypothetical protein
MKTLKGLLAFLLLTTALYAEGDQKLHFGLKAAPSLAWLKSDSPGYTSDGSKFGFSYGLVTEFNFSDHYAFATGIDIAYRGGKFKTVASADSVTTSISSTYSLQYIEIPLTLKLKTNEIGYLTYYLQAGVAPGYNIRARSSFVSTTQITTAGGVQTASSEGNNIDIKDNINNLNFSMIIGGGIEYTLSGSTVLLAGVQFNNGFLDVFDGDAKVNSNYLALTIAVLF